MAKKPKARKPHPPPRSTPSGRVPERAARPAERGRYTPSPTKLTYFRPSWHKAIGIAIMALGLAIVIVNYLDSEAINVLPRGHQEAYFILGVVVAATGTWWLGLFDPPV